MEYIHYKKTEREKNPPGTVPLNQPYTKNILRQNHLRLTLLAL